MIVTVILILTALVALNFVLLIFSCNKTSKVVEDKKPQILASQKSIIKSQKPTVVSTQLQRRPLAATGS
jgi:hypothetical protein